MKKIYITIGAICMAYILASCNKFLDVKPKDEVIPESLEDYESLLNNSSLRRGYADFAYITNSDNAFIPETGDFFSTSTIGIDEIKAYTFQPTFFEEGQYSEDQFWLESYKRIYMYNIIINNVRLLKNVPELQKNSVTAEALLGRAFEYLALVNSYGKHYDPATAASDYGVPLVTSDVIQLRYPKRATVKEIYTQIISDLKASEKNIPEKPKAGNTYRGSKTALNALFARTYLYMGEYKDALKYANDALGANPALLDFNDYKITDTLAARSSIPTEHRNIECVYGRDEDNTYRGRMGHFSPSFVSCASKSLLDAYGDNDLRRKNYFSSEYLKSKFDGEIWCPGIPMNVGITTAEVMLIAAECEARADRIKEAMEWVNKIREKRLVKGTYTPMNATDKTDALLKVVEERRREFPMMGIHRLVDLKRLNKEGVLNVTINHIVQGETYTLLPNDKKYIFPIPKTVLGFNPTTMPKNDRN